MKQISICLIIATMCLSSCKPEIKDVSSKEKSKDKPAKETIGYDSKETNSLDRLIDITAE